MSKPKVLIAEDDAVFRRVLEFSIRKRGFDVEVRHDGRAALERLRGGGVDLLVTDQQMPRLWGVDLLTAVRDERLLPPRQAILCTAKGFEIDRDALIDSLGLIAVLNKPFSPKQLGDLLESASAVA